MAIGLEQYGKGAGTRQPPLMPRTITAPGSHAHFTISAQATGSN